MDGLDSQSAERSSLCRPSQPVQSPSRLLKRGISLPAALTPNGMSRRAQTPRAKLQGQKKHDYPAVALRSRGCQSRLPRRWIAKRAICLLARGRRKKNSRRNRRQCTHGLRFDTNFLRSGTNSLAFPNPPSPSCLWSSDEHPEVKGSQTGRQVRLSRRTGKGGVKGGVGTNPFSYSFSFVIPLSSQPSGFTIQDNSSYFFASSFSLGRSRAYKERINHVGGVSCIYGKRERGVER